MNKLLVATVASLSVWVVVLTLPAGAGAFHVFPYPADYYMCYEAADIGGPLNPPPVILTDQFEQAVYDPAPATRLCPPADRNGTGIDDPVIHLKRYPITRVGPGASVPHIVSITNPIETATLVTLQPKSLMVPATKNTGSPPSGLEPGYEHYKCYAVAPPSIPPTIVFWSDQFASGTVTLIARDSLCNPVRKNADPIRNLARHLVCYDAVPPMGGPSLVITLDQFGAEHLQVGHLTDFCVPSTKRRIR